MTRSSLKTVARLLREVRLRLKIKTNALVLTHVRQLEDAIREKNPEKAALQLTPYIDSSWGVMWLDQTCHPHFYRLTAEQICRQPEKVIQLILAQPN